jgi:hypothetical protein
MLAGLFFSMDERASRYNPQTETQGNVGGGRSRTGRVLRVSELRSGHKGCEKEAAVGVADGRKLP